MKLQSLHRLNSCKAIQAGFMPTYWSVISLSNDRTPEGTGVQETMT